MESREVSLRHVQGHVELAKEEPQRLSRRIGVTEVAACCALRFTLLFFLCMMSQLGVVRQGCATMFRGNQVKVKQEKQIHTTERISSLICQVVLLPTHLSDSLA